MPTRAAQTAPTPGRGAGSNASGRFERMGREAQPDGWDIVEDMAPLRTEVREEQPRRIVSRNESPDLPFDRSASAYRGCEHGCIYCYARPTHAYLGLSAGLDFESRLVARPTAPALLARELERPGYVPQVMALGTVSDPYQPIERDRGITRAMLEVLRDFRHPVAITTRGALIERDLDLLAPMAAEGLVAVGVSIATLDPALSRAMEPRAPGPVRRLRMIRRLAEAGVPVRIAASPLIPALTDHELESILEAAAGAGATSASSIPLRLPGEVTPLFQAWLARHVPDRAARVMGRVRELHGGRDYDPSFGKRMEGQGVWAQLVRRRLDVARERYGLAAERHPLRTDLFRVPPRAGQQMDLFG